MNKESTESLVVHSSSIALLQERFRQLQRAKEMREEQELLRQITEPHRDNSTTCQDPSRLAFQSEFIHTLTPQLQGSASFHHHLQSKEAYPWTIETPPTSVNLQYTETVECKSSSFEDPDIDTSLHL